MYEQQAENAKNDPLISEFVRLVDETSSDGIISFDDLTTPPFMKFWSNIVIYKREDDGSDLRVILCGTTVVTMSGFDWTGQTISSLDIGEHDTATIKKTNFEVLTQQKRDFVSGDVFWEKSDHTNWYQVKMPLRRNNAINEVLCLWSFI